MSRSREFFQAMRDMLPLLQEAARELRGLL